MLILNYDQLNFSKFLEFDDVGHENFENDANYYRETPTLRRKLHGNCSKCSQVHILLLEI